MMSQTTDHTPESLAERLANEGLILGFRIVNRLAEWHRLPTWLAVLNLLAIRTELRRSNLFDTDGQTAPSTTMNPGDLVARNSEGYNNDLSFPLMGSAGRRFGRNIPLRSAQPNPDLLMTPNPREISKQLLARRHFEPATTLNLLAAAWIQFQVHDWIAHENSTTQFHDVADPSWPGGVMRVAKTEPDLTPGQPGCPVFRNRNSHWWDGSQIYGSTNHQTTTLRDQSSKHSGQLQLGPDQLLPAGPAGLPQTGFGDNWWLGLEFLHTLFALEHNAICDRLKTEYPQWSADQLFNTGRLINTALMAKIHTVEWTPGILNHPALVISMNANWYGLLGKQLRNALGRVLPGELFSGILGSETDHHGAPFSLTEEFAAVYRLHSLIPDKVYYRRMDGPDIGDLSFADGAFQAARAIMQTHQLTMTDIGYTLGTNNPGALRLHNYPEFLRNLQLPDQGGHLDLAAVDILRDRERGVPRYNDFRELVHKRRVRTFEELTGADHSPEERLKVWANEIKMVYNGDIEAVDLLVGTLSEPLPRGFGFSDTIFRIFILMASRRLKSDRFFTQDFTPEVYTPVGMEWIQNTGMKEVLVRHFPQLAIPLHRVSNAFSPWTVL